jgi:hypothetical protein
VIVLEGIAAVLIGIDVLGRGPGHELLAACVEGLDLDLHRLVHQHAVGRDGGLETGRLEFCGDILRCLVVLGRAGPVRLGGQGLQVLAGELGVGHGQEDRIPLGLLGKVLVAEDLRGGRRRCRLRRQGQRQLQESQGG